MTKLEVTTPSDLEIRLVRRFKAPARLVFDYNTRPEHITRWLLGPPGWSMPVCEVDLRVGGRYRYVWRNDATGAQFGSTGEFREVEPGRRLVATESMEGFDGQSLNTQTFEEADGWTTMTSTMKFPSKEARDGALATGMAVGVGVSYDRLEGLLAA